MRLNGKIPSENVWRAVSSYVVQKDASLIPSLTVRETLNFAAVLRLPQGMDNSAKIAKAEYVMNQLGLAKCADVLVGSSTIRGISGGERRRVGIAVQILSNPTVLILDEPTSGLDGSTAAGVMDMLFRLADEGRTVICTLHQTSSKLFPNFGNLLLLAQGGRMLYSGKAQNMIEYFDSVGYQFPPDTNPWCAVVILR
jgi:ABC-type multidrug transport system ATPase subunit